MDIRAALDATKTTTGDRCKIGRWLDAIPDEQPGKAELTATLEETDQGGEHWRPLHALDTLLVSLGLRTSNKTIIDHRAGRCRCD